MKKIKWIVFTVLVLCFGIVAYLVLSDKTVLADNFVYNSLVIYRSDFITGFFKFITFFASEIMVTLVSIIVFLFFKNKKYGVLVTINAICILVLNICLKLIFMRERPLDLMIITENGYSFPSGHAMAALGFYGFIIYLLWHMNLRKKVKVIFSVLLSILIILIVMSRIYLGVHYASDVFAGYLVSGAYLILYITLVKRYLWGVIND